jgi:hypothetical protein
MVEIWKWMEIFSNRATVTLLQGDMESDSEEEWEEASEHPPASPTCGQDSSDPDPRPYTTARVKSREVPSDKASVKVASRDFQLGTQTDEQEFLELTREEMMESLPDSPLPRGQVIFLS